jgi:uncharacterized repeat protein (TIGR01451 family)
MTRTIKTLLPLIVLTLSALVAMAVVAGQPALVPQASLGFTDTPTPEPTNTPTPGPGDGSPPSTPTPTPQPVLRDPYIIKQVNLEQARVGDIVVFTIDVINPNPVAISNVVVGDALSPLVDYLSASVPRGSFSYDAGTRMWTLNLGAMGPEERLTLTITTRVNERAQPPNTLLNTAVLTSSLGITQSNTTNTLIVPGELPGTGRR